MFKNVKKSVGNYTEFEKHTIRTSFLANDNHLNLKILDDIS